MKLSTEQREQVRLSILRLCLNGTTLGLLVSYLRSEGFSKIDRDDVEQEIEYLMGKNLLEEAAKKIAPGNPFYATTDDGAKCLGTPGGD